MMLFVSIYIFFGLACNYVTITSVVLMVQQLTEENNTLKELVNMYGVLHLLVQQKDSKKRKGRRHL